MHQQVLHLPSGVTIIHIILGVLFVIRVCEMELLKVREGSWYPRYWVMGLHGRREAVLDTVVGTKESKD